jgi:acyl-ACP thioesterase
MRRIKQKRECSMKEQDYTYDMQAELSNFDEHGCLKPYVYQNFFTQLVGRHMKNVSTDYETLLRYDLAWVLVSLSIDIKKPIIGAMPLIARTWFAQHRGPFYRRDFRLENESGEVMINGSSFSVLFNVHTRSVSRQSALPFVMPAPHEEYTMEASPIFRSRAQYEKIEARVMRPSYIDGLGHVNNARYGEFAYDVLTEPELAQMPGLRRIDLYFISELRKGDTLSVWKATEEGRILVRGIDEAKQGVAFETVLSF